MDVEQLLAEWRAAEGVLASTEPGTREHAEARRVAQVAAEAYQKLLNQKAKTARELADPGHLER